MKKRLQVIMHIIVCLLMTMMLTTSAFAETFSAKTFSNKTDIKKGEQITITFSISDIQGLEKGFNACKGTFEYDEQIFEEVTVANFIPQNKWEKLMYNTTTKEFVLINRNGNISNQDIIQVNLKAKQDIAVGSAKFSFLDLQLSEGKKDVEPSNKDVSVSINIIQDDTILQNGTLGNSVNTGIDDRMNKAFVALAIVSFAIIFVLILRLKNKNKHIAALFVLGILLTQLDPSVLANELKGDVDGNAKLEYNDIYLMQAHLIHLKTIDKEKQDIADVNSDKKITVTDLSLLVSQVKDFGQDEFEVSAKLDSFYVGKEDEFSLDLLIKLPQGKEVNEVIINGNTYPVSKKVNDVYSIKVKANNKAGIQDFLVSGIKLKSGETISVSTNIQMEVLKTTPTIEEFEYTKEGTNIHFGFVLKDEDHAITKAKVIVTDGKKELFSSTDVKVGKNTFVAPTNTSEDYYVKVIADYDLDSNIITSNDNVFTDYPLDEQLITFTEELIELKDIEGVQLFKKENGKVVEVESITVNTFHPQDYIAKVNMKDMPAMYVEIVKGIEEANKDFNLVLKYNNAVQYNGETVSSDVKVRFGTVVNGVAKNVTIQSLIHTIQNNPNASITLTQDLDFSNWNTQDATYLGEFKGKLNGNGYAIKNGNKALFDSLNGAIIENLIISNAQLTNKKSAGILANNAENTTIKNTHIIDSKIIGRNNDGTGSFIGNAKNQTHMEASSASNISVEGSKRVGGFTGYLRDNSSIKNCYVQGIVIGGNDATGGIVGETSGNGMSIQSSYSSVNLIVTKDTANAGIVGYSDRSAITLQNNISVSNGEFGYRIFGNGISNQSSKNYFVKETKLKSNTSAKEMEIEGSKINDSFFKENLDWSTSIWNLDQVTSKHLPRLKNNDPRNQINATSATPTTEGVYIPEFARLSKLETYKTENEIAYHNMYKLMPFYDAKFIVTYGNKIAASALFNQEKISMILPYDASGNMINNMNVDNYKSISKIRIIFENEATQEYKVVFRKKINDIAAYTISDLGVTYTYNQYILNHKSPLVEEILTKAKGFDYKSQIAAVTSENESRLYVDYYNQKVKPNLNEVIQSMLSHIPEYNVYIDNDILKTKIKQELFENALLEKMLYSYNYIDKWYRIPMGGSNLSDVIYFYANSINKNMNVLKWNDIVLGNNRETGRTQDFYYNGIRSRIGQDKDLKGFLEYYIKVLANYDNASKWFKDTFKGILNEKPMVGKEKEVRYTAWDLMNARNHILLPILTAPQEDMYLISVPSQIVVGSMKRYKEYYSGNPADMKNLIDGYATKISNFYNTSSGFIQNAYEILNKKAHIQYDTRFNFPDESGTPGKQESGKTEDPVLKWVYEAVGSFAAENGSGAYANGTDVYWVVYAALGGDFSFKVFTHETAHNQDGYYFYEGNGRREQTGAEDHADYNIAQDLGDGSVVFNLRRSDPPTIDDSNNLTVERINTPEKIHDYYKDMFETYYVLDYLTAQAFLQLTPEEQSKVATQVSHGENTDYNIGGRDSNYQRKTAADFANMKLKNMNDLWDNGIVLRSPGKVSGALPGSYDGDNHYNIYWYQPHNDNGRADSYSFKRFGFEMLGVGGYSDGYVIYRSTKSKNDLDALKQITKDENMTYKKYKMDRYDHVKENLSKIPHFNADEVIQLYKSALEQDARNGNHNQTNNLRRVLYGVVKRATQDFTTGTVYEGGTTIKVSSAQSLIDEIKKNPWGTFELTSNLDFGNIQPIEGAYIQTPFVGRLIGKNNKLEGLKAPLMKTIVYGNIQDLIIETPIYEESVTASIALEAKNTIFSNVQVKEMNLNAPLVAKQNGLILRLNGTKTSTKLNPIGSLEELKKVINSETTMAKKLSYILTKDIDVSELSSGDSLFKGDFFGIFDGGGHSLIHAKVPIFSNVKGTVQNLKIKNSEIVNANKNDLGTLTRYANGATIQNVVIENAKVEGYTNVAAVASSASNSKFRQVTIQQMDVKVHRYYGAGLIGRGDNNTIEDVVVTGNLQVKETHNGGLIGAMRKDRVNRAYVGVNISKFAFNGDNRNKNAGLYGNIETGPISIDNVVVVGDANNDLYKITPATTDGEKSDINKYLRNVYEYDLSKGLKNANGTSIKEISKSQLMSKSFYTNDLKLSETVWDFSDIGSTGIPKLKFPIQ